MRVPNDNIIEINGVINDNTVIMFYQKLQNVRSKRHIVRINSGGGIVGSGFDIITMITQKQSKGHKFICISTGVTASMAATILQSCDIRYGTIKSNFMQHKSFVYGKIPKHLKEAFEANRRYIYNARFSITMKRINISYEEFLNKYVNEERFFNYKEALRINYIDSLY